MHITINIAENKKNYGVKFANFNIFNLSRITYLLQALTLCCKSIHLRAETGIGEVWLGLMSLIYMQKPEQSI